MRIVTDSSADMPNGWDKTYEVNILPMNIQFGGKTYLQGVDLDSDRFYEIVNRTHMIPKTSLPSPRQVQSFYEKIATFGDAILSIHVASKMSGTFGIVQGVAQEMSSRFQIYPFDSGSGSAVLAYMCREARILDQSGANVQEIIDKLEGIRKRITVIFTLDSVEFARMSGRISAFQAAMTSMLQIKPIILLKDGLLEMAEKVRTRRRSLDRVLDIVRDRVGQQKVNIAIVHARDAIAAQALAERVRDLFNVRDIIMTELSISVAANLGPGTVGIVAYPVDEN